MKRTKLFPVLIAMLMLFIFTAPASAMAVVLDSTTCSGPGYSWDYGTNTCTISGDVIISSDLTIPAGTTLTIIAMGSIDISHVTMTNDIGGTINNNWEILNHGTIRNHGTFSNNGVIFTSDTILNDGTFSNFDTIQNIGNIINSGTLDNSGRSFTNFGQYAIIRNLCGGIITGTGTITYNPVQYEYGCSSTSVPEFPTVALPVIAVIGLMFLFQRRKGK